MSYDFKVGDIVTRDMSAPNSSWWRDVCDSTGVDPCGFYKVTRSDKASITLSGFKGLFNKSRFHPAGRADKSLCSPPPLPLTSKSMDEGNTSCPTYTGGSSDYYQVTIKSTTTEGRPEYIAECNDIIEALGMNFAEGNAFKAIWRRAAQRTLGLTKAGAKADGLYDAEKVEFFGKRLVEQSKCLTIK
ncbi:hypothetical protein phiPccP1_00015 [Pectobacterium phage phiPccP-1]|nr:hypothetical protein phiPccP1_00015 [Pectobacterium phage phiPccP-1]